MNPLEARAVDYDRVIEAPRATPRTARRARMVLQHDPWHPDRYNTLCQLGMSNAYGKGKAPIKREPRANPRKRLRAMYRRYAKGRVCESFKVWLRRIPIPASRGVLHVRVRGSYP